MSKFRISITETQTGFIDVEAECGDEALEMYLEE